VQKCRAFPFFTFTFLNWGLLRQAEGRNLVKNFSIVSKRTSNESKAFSELISIPTRLYTSFLFRYFRNMRF